MVHHSLTPVRLSLALFICVLLATQATAVAVHAQVVTGQVFDSIDGTPVGIGFVVLLDGRGIEVGRALSDHEGRFVIRASTPGRYRLRSERIGYRASETHWFTLSASHTLEYDLHVKAIPVRLASIEVLGETECGAPERGSGIGSIWEEIRKALAAASWSADNLPYHYRLHRFERDVDENRRRLFREDIDVEWGSFRSPYVTRAPDSLAELGYVRSASDGVWYYAPDANVLLSRSFQQTHCFQMVRGGEEKTGLIGLAFEPVPGREKPDIFGTLWVDEVSSELHSIEYRYSGALSRDPSLGGTIEFQQIRSGAWVIGRWEISVPTLVDLRRGRRLSRQTVGDLRAVRHGGGQVIEVEDLDGSSIYVSPDLVRLRGTVYDSIRGHALGNELVSIVGTGYRTLTKNDGSFDFTALLNGEYSLTSARLDSLGYLAGRVPVRFVPGDTVVASLAVPRLRRVHDALCPEGLVGSVLHGTVREPIRGEPFSNQRVFASWEEYPMATENPREHRREARSDDSGRYALCDLPEHRSLTIWIGSDDFEIETTAIQFVSDEVEILNRGGLRSFAAPERVWRLDLQLQEKSNPSGH